MKQKKVKKSKILPKRRHIEDAPFYQFQYQWDDLPLDPAKPFLMEKIARLKQTKSIEFHGDFDIHIYDGFDESVLLEFCSIPNKKQKIEEELNRLTELPPNFAVLEQEIKFSYSFTSKAPYQYTWLDDLDLEKPSEHQVREVTNQIIKLYKERRNRIFQRHTKTKSCLYSNEMKRLHGGPSDVIGSFKSSSASSLRLPPLRRPHKSKLFQAGDPSALRTSEEIRQELEKVSQVIDKLIEPDIKRNLTEKEINRQPSNSTKNLNKKCQKQQLQNVSGNASQKIFHPKVKREKLNTEQYMKILKEKEKEKLRYMEGLLPVEPEEQKQRILKRYENDMDQSLKLFTDTMKQKTINLMKNISVLNLESYPSKLIKKVLPKLGKTIPFFKRAHRFILREEKLWPNIHPEVILMDYLFNPENEVKEEEATLIISCLIDLQEDYRYHVKRAFLRYILKSRFERKRLQLEMEPPDFPILAIRSPVPWKVRIQVAKNRLDQILMVTHPVLQALNVLWHQLYNDILIFDTRKLYQDDIPLNADAITELIINCCLVARDILVNDWLPRAADLLDAMKNTWRDLVPRNTSFGGRAAILFNCVHGLMSYQLQGLITRSVQHFFRAIDVYKEGNNIEKYDPDHPKLKRRPLMTLIVSVVGKHFETKHTEPVESSTTIYKVDEDDPHLVEFSRILKESTRTNIRRTTLFILKHTGKMFVYPYMTELPELFVSYFKKILRVGYKIPRLEYLMSQREDQYGHLHYIDENNVDMMKLYENVRKIVENNWTGPTTYLYPIYTYYFPLLAGEMKAITENIFLQPAIPDLSVFEDLMKKLNELLEGIYYLRDYIPMNLFMLDNRHANETLAMLVRDIINFITNYFKILNLNENRRICDEFEEMSMKAGERPKETPEVVQLQDYLAECRDKRIFNLKAEIQIVAYRVIFLLHYATLDNEDIHLNTRTFLWPSELEQVLELSAARLNVVRDNLEVALKEKRTKFEVQILSEKQKMDSFRLKESREILSLDELKEKVDTVDELMEILEKCSNEAKAINIDEQLLQLDQSFFPVLNELIEKMEPIEKLWKTAYEFDKSHEIWFYGPFEDLNADAIKEEVENMYQVVYKLSRQLVGNPTAKRVAEQIRLKIDKFKFYLPVLDAICRQGLSQRHWDQISEQLGQPCTPELYPSLKAMVDVDIMGILPQLEEISNAAGKEFELNAQLVTMQAEWKDVKFEVLQYRDTDTHMLASVDDIQSILDDHILKAQAMRGSPYIQALGAKADDWENKLLSMQDILDIWLQVQSTWMYLEPIFSSEDIMRQMPVEGRNFKAVDKMWRKIMKSTQSDPRVIQATDYQNLLDTLRKALRDLEGVQKGLNTYLEKKRIFFPRFFFLSNDELLEILSETKDPQRVQPHLRKCFEGINSLQFDQNLEITAMVSAEQEVVPLTKKITPNAANGLVEIWLKEVQVGMLETMQEHMWISWDDYFKETRIKWVLKWPGQIVQCTSCMAWTQQVEDAIQNNKLPQYLDKCNGKIGDLVSLMRGGSLSQGETITIEAMILLDVHARDIAKYLMDTKVADVMEFNWISQLRYYWRTDETNKQEFVCVSMVVTDVRYGMEYLGNISRLVVTPLTDRYYRTLMGAMKLCLGGASEGPAGTGKTETCKDLAKAVAKKCVVFNCSDGLDYKALTKFFKGLAQSGSWACFDEFNRIELEVLSVVAQQILTIQRAISRKIVKIVFEDTIMRLDRTCSIFITMNPGHAGRTELPDNLKVLFRTVAMMIPDYTMIGELTLYSKGFDEARSLAQKIVNTYKLCSEQLSSQSHYDYGMRAVKSVLLASSSLRRQYPNLPEAQIVLKAIIDVNLPKFLEQDIQLFVDIYKDLFPGVEVPESEREDVLKWVRKKLKEKNLQETPWFVEKVLQIYEMLLVRHGLMIIGGPMGGKTTAYQILAEALKAIRSDSQTKFKEYSVNMRVINPKAINMGQLYGCFDPVSHEWTDGVLAKTFREMAYNGSNERNWIVFDGPVDSIWIENLNTVLDDNKKLCLMSGEIIQMSKMMNMIFEPADLDQASPGTVSRCGMIYMEPKQLGWDALHKSFLVQLESHGLNEIYMGLFEELVSWLVPAAIEILPKCKSMLDISPIYQYQMLSTFFMHFLAKTQQYNQTWFQQMFLFCLAWAYGSALTNEGRKVFDILMRKVLYGSSEDFPRPRHFSLNRGQMFPEKLLLLDYRYDEVENWWPWLRVEDAELPAEAQISELIIPTKETGYIIYWLNLCLVLQRPLLLIGPTGTGKSSTIINHVRTLPRQTHITNVVNFSARTLAQQVQESIMSKLDRRRKGVFGPPVGKKCIVFCDDVSMPSKDLCGSQPPLELLRQWIDHRYWSDLKDTSKLELIDLLFVGAMGTLGGSNYIYPRLYRHMYVMAVDGFEDATLNRIFNTIADWHFAKDFPEKVALLSRGLADALISVYREVTAIYLPTPAKSHYTFSLRDVTQVLQGIVLVPPKRLTDPEKLVRLWVHETYRVFYDRLIEQKDREQLLQLVRTACKTHMRFTLEQAMADRIEPGGALTDDDLRGLFFGNYMEPDADPKIYDEIESYDKLEKVMHYYLQEYNTSSDAPMDMVLFRFAIEHISRVSRVLQMPRGNILMVGLGGSGRKSSAKLAASIADAELMTIQITKTYSVNDWQEDMKKLLMKAGIGTKPTVFLFSESQAVDELFIENINTMLNTGDLPNLFQSDEKATILENMQNIVKQMDKPMDPSPIALYGYFNERIREKLHFALAFSPIGASFKQRLRMYPSLINCCTIDWFTAWPKDALLRVAERFVSSMQIGKAEKDQRSEVDLKYDKTSKKLILTPLEKSIVDMVIHFNKTIIDASKRCYLELSRKNYVTPASYLEMLKSFKSFYIKKYEEITLLRDRYTTGLEKLDSAAGQVGLMQQNLYELQPQLKILSEETEKIMVNIERETAEAEKKKEVVGADEAAANEAAAAAQAIKDDCESDLQEAIPALEAALEALDTLKPGDITVVKSMRNPPSGVKLVLEAVCVLKGLKPDRKADPTGKITEEYWGPSLRMLGDMKFLDSLKTFDKDNIAPAIIKKIREKYIKDREFIPEKIKNVSTACEGLCKWVRAMDVYDRVAKIVAPKKIALAGAEAELAQQMEKLNSKRAELQEILDKLQKLNDYFAEKSREKKRLEDEIDNCEKKLNRAEKLLGGLSGEKSRWSETANRLHKSLHNVVGDVLLAAGCIAYLGFFTTEYRVEIISDWNNLCIAKGIPCTEKFSLATTLGNAIKFDGLPSDNFSIENGIIVTNARRYPLMIDPQVQANKWVKTMEKDNNLKVIKQTDANYMQVVEMAIKNGYPVLLENIGETIDPSLFSILERNVIKNKEGHFIKSGDSLIEYNHNFRFYITTCYRNPHYVPEIAVMVTILNFMITGQGLREQLLATVVVHERPDLQEKKELLILESTKNRDALYNIETKILQVLSSSEGNILEDENAINILSTSKTLSEEIQEKQVVAISTETEIDDARQQYLPVAKHTAILFFCITELANIDPMYQYSLAWFLNLFISTILKAPQTENLGDRLNQLNDHFTKSIYQNVCRSLFEKDKLIISFVMCIGILNSKGKVNKSHLIFFLTGGIRLDNPHPNPAPNWLSDKSWNEIVRASDLEGLEDFYKNFAENINVWHELYDLSNPEEAQFPSPYNNSVDQLLLGLILLKCIRPDKLVPAVRKFITTNMDKSFIEPPPFDLQASFDESDPATPLVFLLSPGCDPIMDVFGFAKYWNMYDKCKLISLGQGQGPKAEKMIAEAQKSGHWILLQNCHVARNWFGELERICTDTVMAKDIHRDYRLWCSSYSIDGFPVSVLQNSVKMTNEPPKGLKMKMLRLYNSDPVNNDKFFNNAFSGDIAKCWFRGVFSMAFFHAILQERREFGPLGWNIPYEFNDSDFKISLQQLKMLVRQHGTIPFDGHRYLTGECIYGGRVTDDKDRRLLLSLLDTVYNKNIIIEDNYSLSASGNYKIPLEPNKFSSIEYISEFPLNPHPEVFGLHENAAINRNQRDTNSLLFGILLTQTQLMAASRTNGTEPEGLTQEKDIISEDPVFHLCNEILSRLPDDFDIDEITAKYPLVYSNSMNTILRQEVIRYNRLLQYIRKSLINVQRAVQGQIAMIPELEGIHASMLIGKLPSDWLSRSYPSLKSLGSYINDFLARIEFFRNWITNGEPNVFWLSGFYFTQPFITGILQNYARKHKLQIDLLSMKFHITDFEIEARNSPDIGVYIKGLYLEGARWNREIRSLDESLPKILFDAMPIILMEPILKSNKDETYETKYESPIYKTSERREIISSKDNSTNFIMFIELDTNLPPNHWINRGTACLCQLDE